MRVIVKNVFLFLLSIFMFILYVKNAHFLGFLYLNNLVEVLILILLISLIVFVVNKLNRWIETLRFPLQIQFITSFLLILLLAYDIFTPYFYPEDYLKEVGIGKIEGYQQLANLGLSNKERIELAEDVVGKEITPMYSITGSYPKVDALEKVEVIDFKRNFNQYELIVEGNQDKGESMRTFEYTFAKEWMDFKIIGFGEAN